MESKVPVSEALTLLGIPHRVFQHPGPVASFEQAAEERGQKPEQIIRSIVFRLTQETFAMVLIAGKSQVAWKELRKLTGQKRISMATEEEVLFVTGYQRGAVGPFGFPTTTDDGITIQRFVDQSVIEQDEISLGSGRKGTTIILQTADLLRGLEDAPIVHVKKET